MERNAIIGKVGVALNNLFERMGWIKGYAWGHIKKTNCFSGDSVIIGSGGELVVVSHIREGEIAIHEFVLRDKNKYPLFLFGDEVRKELEQNGFRIKG